MKAKFSLSLIFGPTILAVQGQNSTVFQSDMNFIYQHVNRTPVTTGVLKDYGLLSTNLASGTLVKEGKFQSKKISVEVGNLKKGTYYLRVTVKDTFFTERIVVE